MRETIRRKPLVLLALLATLAMTSGCKSDAEPAAPGASGTIPKAQKADDELVATVGKVTITRGQLLEQLLAAYGAQTLRSMMLQEAVNEEAATLHIEVTDDELEVELRLMRQGYEDEEDFYRAMNEQLGMNREEVRSDARYRLLLEKIALGDITVTQSEIDRYLEEHPDQFLPKEQYQWAQIVVLTDERARQLLALLEEGEDFAELARSNSLDEFTADEGGNVGWIEAGDPFEAPALLETVAMMQVGEVTGPIELDKGYAIVRLDGRREIRTKSPDEIASEVRKQLALGKALPIQELEQNLLEKYRAEVKDATLQQ
ncbi:peptidyl-prolyl cis-trans isomerase [Cohnella herbarum]|uniref:peptidylprolyl isomerase n=1 Tax=Cohnella herbarum TaxID=2728023 RepID=A0A7Z2ZN67_9BACL|nr:peptidyl-prolyl cis-trans isomerase [Cohnella herbarum]QJD85883.1 peptidylprolyl isomerase [Cohnella herbarum]